MFKNLFCKHDYKPWANVYGDLINDVNARTVMQCTKCGKRVFKKEYIRAPIDYNNFMEWAYYMKMFKKTNNEEYERRADSLIKKVCKDVPLFIETFVGGKLK